MATIKVKKLILSFCLIFSIFGLSQNQPMNDTIIDVIKKQHLDTIVNFYTPKFANHSEYQGKILDLLYLKNTDVILNMVHTKGFLGLTYLYPNHVVKYAPSDADSCFLNLFHSIIGCLPKKKSDVKTTLSTNKISNDTLLFEEYTFSKNNNDYLLRFLYRNLQMEGILIEKVE